MQCSVSQPAGVGKQAYFYCCFFVFPDSASLALESHGSDPRRFGLGLQQRYLCLPFAVNSRPFGPQRGLTDNLTPKPHRPVRQPGRRNRPRRCSERARAPRGQGGHRGAGTPRWPRAHRALGSMLGEFWLCGRRGIGLCITQVAGSGWRRAGATEHPLAEAAQSDFGTWGPLWF